VRISPCWKESNTASDWYNSCPRVKLSGDDKDLSALSVIFFVIRIFPKIILQLPAGVCGHFFTQISMRVFLTHAINKM